MVHLVLRNLLIQYVFVQKKVRQVNLYSHLINKHELKTIYARSLIKALENNLDPKTTKLFDSNEDIINHLYKIKCPFTNGIIDLFNSNQKIIDIDLFILMKYLKNNKKRQIIKNLNVHQSV
jgi:hypothetical protein